jgi:lipopolysaccharide/colanic/teichoic acid biosynthesis glycosyltransferase
VNPVLTGEHRKVAAKRLLDVSLAVPALLLLTPILALIAIAVKLESPGNPIYMGRRVGRFGKPFNLVKFRTMVLGADRIGPLVTASGDPRITRLGRFLRRTKLDELPSLWNVISGDMSLVGPRPENEQAAALYTGEQREVLSLLPGITSLATLKYHHEEALLAAGADLESTYFQLMQDKLNLELQYVHTRNLALDLRILFRTVLALF